MTFFYTNTPIGLLVPTLGAFSFTTTNRKALLHAPERGVSMPTHYYEYNILAAVSRVEQRLYFVTCRATDVFCHVSSNGCILSRVEQRLYFVTCRATAVFCHVEILNCPYMRYTTDGLYVQHVC